MGSIFDNNGTQVIRLPAQTCFPDEVKKVNARVIGKDMVISAPKTPWGSFFKAQESVSEDLLEERVSQKQSE
ncbi:type II toxin-antitoxin system VapB family antitoxin [Pseudomaricurvus alkylphenolicus]|uniref:type II toxin-antitoxin system VapB family antitoxin n=1 Tax=Pseudomaricurvus alkylphenolicus TaxID=1306991 RepID=UPI0030B86B72